MATRSWVSLDGGASGQGSWGVRESKEAPGSKQAPGIGRTRGLVGSMGVVKGIRGALKGLLWFPRGLGDLGWDKQGLGRVTGVWQGLTGLGG